METGKDEVHCRICLEDDFEEMVSPCNCTGSMKNVHRRCLSKWQKYKHLNGYCEICKFTFLTERIRFVGFRKSCARIYSHMTKEENISFYILYFLIAIQYFFISIIMNFCACIVFTIMLLRKDPSTTKIMILSIIFLSTFVCFIKIFVLLFSFISDDLIRLIYKHRILNKN